MNSQLYADNEFLRCNAPKTPVLNWPISWSLFWPLIWLMVPVCVQVLLLHYQTIFKNFSEKTSLKLGVDPFGWVFRTPVESRVNNLRLADFFLERFSPDFLFDMFRRFFFTISHPRITFPTYQIHSNSNVYVWRRLLEGFLELVSNFSPRQVRSSQWNITTAVGY